MSKSHLSSLNLTEIAIPKGIPPFKFLYISPTLLPQYLKVIALLVGVFFCSTAIIFIKASEINPVLLAGLRLLVAVVFLAPLFLRDFKRYVPKGSWTWRPYFFPSFLLSIHFMSWLIAARMTGAANATLIVNLSPVVMPIILYLMLGEKVNRRELMGTGLALGGTLILFGADLHLSQEYFLGDVLCFVSMVFFTIYLVLARKERTIQSIWVYVVPIYALSGVMAITISLFWVNPLMEPWSSKEGLLLLGLAFIPTVMGHTLLNWSMTQLRGQLVGIFNMFQFLFAGVMAYFIFSENPGWEFIPACLLVVSGGVLAVKPTTSK